MTADAIRLMREKLWQEHELLLLLWDFAANLPGLDGCDVQGCDFPAYAKVVSAPDAWYVGKRLCKMHVRDQKWPALFGLVRIEVRHADHLRRVDSEGDARGAVGGWDWDAVRRGGRR